MESGGPYFSTGQRLQWHPSVHEAVGHETLHYWLLAFSTSYEWEMLEAELIDLLGSFKVRSFALYELMGEFDVMLRVWMPPDISGVFRADLQGRLQRFSLTSDRHYAVEEILRHWPFAPGGKGAIVPLGPGAASPSPAEIEKANALMVEEGTLDDPFLASLASSVVIGPKSHDRDQVEGVKIVTLIKPVSPLSNAQKRGLAKQLALTLDQQPAVVQRSLYQVEGQDAAFILTCLAPKDSFFAFRDELVRGLAPLLETAGARTNSYASSSAGLLMFQDVITAPGVRRMRKIEARTAEELLSQEESTTLEVKGSALAPLDPWLFGDEQLVESPVHFHRGVLRAIVGLLNTDGGTVLIGALERQRYKSRLSEAQMKSLDFKEIGAYLCLGLVDPTFTGKGWDAYERRLAEMTASNVTADPSALISLRKEEIDGAVFCLIDVQPGGELGWHYLQPQRGDGGPQFLVRQGARTVALGGLDADRYKETRQ
jgi:hypothetical protein